MVISETEMVTFVVSAHDRCQWGLLASVQGEQCERPRRRLSPHGGQVVTSGPQTLRSSAAQSSRRASVVAGGVVAL